LRANRLIALPLVLAAIALSGARVSAHRLDELLQAARIAIEPDRVTLELSITPGIAVTDGIVRDIDANSDGTLSSFERLEYAAHVLSGMTLRIDDAVAPRLKLKGSHFPDLDSMRTGDGVIQIQSEAEVPRLGAGAHRLVFRNDNGSEGSVYLANALLSDDNEIAVTRQARDVDQRELTIDFVMLTSKGRAMWMGIAALLLAAVVTRGRYARENMYSPRSSTSSATTLRNCDSGSPLNSR